jgi:hypothetical protein
MGPRGEPATGTGGGSGSKFLEDGGGEAIEIRLPAAAELEPSGIRGRDSRRASAAAGRETEPVSVRDGRVTVEEGCSFRDIGRPLCSGPPRPADRNRTRPTITRACYLLRFMLTRARAAFAAALFDGRHGLLTNGWRSTGWHQRWRPQLGHDERSDPGSCGLPRKSR